MPTKRLYTIYCRGNRRMPFLGFVCLIGIINEPDNLILHNHIPISNSKAPHLSNSAGQAEIIQKQTLCSVGACMHPNFQGKMNIVITTRPFHI